MEFVPLDEVLNFLLKMGRKKDFEHFRFKVPFFQNCIFHFYTYSILNKYLVLNASVELKI